MKTIYSQKNELFQDDRSEMAFIPVLFIVCVNIYPAALKNEAHASRKTYMAQIIDNNAIYVIP